MRVLLSKNKSVREISKVLSIPKSAVHRFAKVVGINTNNKAGRKKILKSTNITYAVTQLASNKSKTVAELTKALNANEGIKVSPQTLSRELYNAGMKATKKKKKPMI